MKFAEFKERIESEYHKRFNDSFCKCRIYKCLGKSITIDCYLAKDASEAPNGYAVNDTFHVSFMIFMPDGWNEEDDMPEVMTMRATGKSVRVKPEDRYCYCGYKSIAYRQTKGNAEKQIATFSKTCDKLLNLVREEYGNGNLLEDSMELIRLKGYAA